MKKYPLFYELLVSLSEGFPSVPEILEEHEYPYLINHQFVEDSLSELSIDEFKSFTAFDDNYDEVINKHHLFEIECFVDSISAVGEMCDLYFDES